MSEMREKHPVEKPTGPVLALDLGRKHVGVAISDVLLISITKLNPLRRSNWKRLLLDVGDLTRRLDAKTLVIGFPLSMNGSKGTAALDIQRVAENFARSLEMPVYLQDERLTSREAEEQLRAAGHTTNEIRAKVDSQAAAIILREFLAGGQPKIPVSPASK